MVISEFSESKLFKKYRLKQPSDPVDGKYFVDIIDLRYTTNLSTFVEDQRAFAQLRLDNTGFPHIKFVGELMPLPDPNEMLFISHLTKVEKGHTDG